MQGSTTHATESFSGSQFSAYRRSGKKLRIIFGQNPPKQTIQSPPLFEAATRGGLPPVSRPYSHDLRLLGHICWECLCSSLIRVKGGRKVAAQETDTARNGDFPRPK